MILHLLGSMLVWTYGILFIVYAYREPPPALAWLFRARVPLLFGILLAFVPDQHTIKVARIGIGAFLLLVAVIAALRAFYHFFFGWS